MRLALPVAAVAAFRILGEWPQFSMATMGCAAMLQISEVTRPVYRGGATTTRKPRP